jgi:hypothetical protein
MASLNNSRIDVLTASNSSRYVSISLADIGNPSSIPNGVPPREFTAKQSLKYDKLDTNALLGSESVYEK